MNRRSVTVRWTEEVDFLETDWKKLFRFEVKGPRKVNRILYSLQILFNHKKKMYQSYLFS